MVRVVDLGTGWTVLVDGVVRGYFGSKLYEAVHFARKWGF